jgi:hypothetical protein
MCLNSVRWDEYVDITGRNWQKDQEIHNAEHCNTYSPQTGTKCTGMKWIGHVAGIRAEKCIKNLDPKNWTKMALWQAAHEWEGNIKMHKKTYSAKGHPLSIWFITGLLLGSAEHQTEPFSFITGGKCSWLAQEIFTPHRGTCYLM